MTAEERAAYVAEQVANATKRGGSEKHIDAMRKMAESRTHRPTKAQPYDVRLIVPGERGELVNVIVVKLPLFRIEEHSTVEDDIRDGDGTWVRQIFVGGKPQLGVAGLATPALNAILVSSRFLDTIYDGLCLTFLIEFEKTCTWTAHLRGTGYRAAGAGRTDAK